jgi:hypothetical protein
MAILRSERRIVTVLALRQSTTDGRPGVRREFNMRSAEVTVGRSESCREESFFGLTNTLVSRRHGCFSRSKDGWFYRDFNSANGSWWNGSRVRGDVGPVRVGDEFAFGEMAFAWVIVESSAAVLPRHRDTDATAKSLDELQLSELCLQVLLGHDGPASAEVAVASADGRVLVSLPARANRARELLARLAQAAALRSENAGAAAGWVSRQELVDAMGWRDSPKGFNSCLRQVQTNLGRCKALEGVASRLIEAENRSTRTYYRLAVPAILQHSTAPPTGR